jgi:hypothetical protein
MSAVSAVKLPLLFLVTLAICLPTLYLFNLVFGARLQVRQALALVMTTVTVTSVLSLAFAPIALFFRITAHSYSFYKLLNVAILALAAMVGLKFLTAGMRALNVQTEALAAIKRGQEEQAEALKRAKEQQEAAALHTLLKDDDESPAPVSPAPAAEPALTAPAAPQPNGGAQPAPVPQLVAPHPQQHMQPMMPIHLQHGPYAQPNPQLMRQPHAQPRPQAHPGERPASMTLLYVWILLFGFVGTQLAWTLRPFVGSPGEPFQLFREIDGNFYVDIVRTIGSLF